MVCSLSGEHLNGTRWLVMPHDAPRRRSCTAAAATGQSVVMIRLYGKLPAHGDFLNRGLRDRQARMADRMLTAMIVGAQQAWDDHFAERYAAAQPWLWHAPGSSGLIIPSMDAAGRLFPLGVATATPDLQAVYDLVVEAIAGAIAVDALVGSLTALKQAGDAVAGEQHRKHGLAADFQAAIPSQGHWFLPDDEAPSLPRPDGALWSEIIASQGEVRV